MRKLFFNKLEKEQRTFKWFYDHYIKDKRNIRLKYNTIYQQAKGEFLDSLNYELEEAMREYLKEK
jgi:hypothetical protein